MNDPASSIRCHHGCLRTGQPHRPQQRLSGWQSQCLGRLSCPLSSSRERALLLVDSLRKEPLRQQKRDHEDEFPEIIIYSKFPEFLEGKSAFLCFESVVYASDARPQLSGIGRVSSLHPQDTILTLCPTLPFNSQVWTGTYAFTSAWGNARRRTCLLPRFLHLISRLTQVELEMHSALRLFLDLPQVLLSSG